MCSSDLRQVLDAMTAYYERHNANVHRGAYQLAEEATDALEGARDKVARFIGATSSREVIFTRNATEGINLVAQSWGRQNLGPGDAVVLSHLEHHSNIVPWQMLREQLGIKLVVAPMDAHGELIVEEFQKLLSPRTKLAAFAHVSNALGTLLPVAELTRMAHAAGAKVLIDGAQGAPHIRPDVQTLGCDFYAFSGHKLYGPTGTGVLWGKKELLEAMPPWQGGGDMIRSVTFAKTSYAPVPAKFEAGTPNVAGTVGLGAAIDYLAALPWEDRKSTRLNSSHT